MIDKNKILNKFKQSNVFYRKKLENIFEFENIPFTNKKELVDSQENNKPYGLFTNDNEIHQIYRTSGTSSTPLLLTFTTKDIEIITTIGKECFEYSGMGQYSNNEVVINCLNLSMWAGGFFDAQAMMKTGVQVINFGTGNTSELIKLILTYNKSFKVSLHCTPSYLPIIEKRLEKNMNILVKELNIHSLYLGAEGGVQINEYRQEIINNWQCNVFNANYGMSEVCSIMASANDENILKYSKLFLKYYLVELLLPNNTIKNINETQSGDIGIVIITSLYKESQPLLRYNTAEKIKIIKIENDEIFFEILGREDDMIVYKGINFFPEQIRKIILNYKELTGQFKLEIKQRNKIIDSIDLICELKQNTQINEKSLKNKIEKQIRNEFTVSLNTRFALNLDNKGNKLKIVEFI